MTVTIALDAMGGDKAPRMAVEGAALAASKHPDVAFVLIGQEAVIQAELAALHLTGAGNDHVARITIQNATQVVAMDEKPAQALRTKKDSSIRVGANMVKEGLADAFVSAGNTGALMATAKFVLKTLPAIDRPAIASLIPSTTGATLMLDLGANVDSTAKHLSQFAMMGQAYATTVMGLPEPRIGLLNIGEEEMKGNEMVRQAGEILKDTTPRFVGNVEGTDIFSGVVDVVVCDGFVGNVSLKSMEGVSQLISHFLREAFTHSLMAKMGALVARPFLKRAFRRMDPRAYNGAMLLGLNGVVVKSHGGTDAVGFSHAIGVAVELATKRVTEQIQTEVAKLQTNNGNGVV